MLTVVLVPVPEVVISPGYLVMTHVPLDGNPLKPTLPVDTVHVGGVISPTTGAPGVGGCSGITASDDSADVHPSELVTVKA